MAVELDFDPSHVVRRAVLEAEVVLVSEDDTEDYMEFSVDLNTDSTNAPDEISVLFFYEPYHTEDNGGKPFFSVTDGVAEEIVQTERVEGDLTDVFNDWKSS